MKKNVYDAGSTDNCADTGVSKSNNEEIYWGEIKVLVDGEKKDNHAENGVNTCNNMEAY